MSDTATHSTMEVLQKYWHATTTGDIEALKPLLAENAVFHYPGQHYLSGDYHGREGVADLYRTVTSLGTTLFEGRLHGVALTEDAKYTVAILSYRLKVAAGRSLPGRACGLFRITDGLIEEYWLFEWDQHMINDVWWSSAPQILMKQGDYVRLILNLPRIGLGVVRTMARLFGGYRAPTEG